VRGRAVGPCVGKGFKPDFLRGNVFDRVEEVAGITIQHFVSSGVWLPKGQSSQAQQLLRSGRFKRHCWLMSSMAARMRSAEYSHLIQIHGVHRSRALPSELAAISDVTTNWHELAGAKHVPTIVGNSQDAVAKFSGICQKLDRGLVITWPSIERWIPARHRRPDGLVFGEVIMYCISFSTMEGRNQC
jgi:hypothetical protein